MLCRKRSTATFQHSRSKFAGKAAERGISTNVAETCNLVDGVLFKKWGLLPTGSVTVSLSFSGNDCSRVCSELLSLLQPNLTCWSNVTDNLWRVWVTVWSSGAVPSSLWKCVHLILRRIYKPTCQLRTSSDTSILCLPSVCTHWLGQRSFS